MEKRFDVAGHVFSVVAPDASPLWQRMDNYAPFLTSCDKECVFTLECVEKIERRPHEPLMVDQGIEPEMPRVDLYKEENGDIWVEIAPLSTMDPCGFIRLSADCTHAQLEMHRAQKFCVDNALMLTYAFRTVGLATLEMHSSVVVHEGKAYMFLGHSGAGKSTHSRMWLENIPDTELLNDDNPIVRILDDGTVRVYGSPWSGKTPCYRNASATVQATVSIVQAPHNSIRKLSTMEAFSRLHSSISGYWGDETMVDGLCASISEFIRRVGHFEIECLADADAARLSLQSTRQ